LVILWQIGNCVGADNHRSFIAFLISGLFSTIYISIVSAHAGLHMWPPLTYSIGRIHGTTSENLAWRIVKETIFAFGKFALLLSTYSIDILHWTDTCICVSMMIYGSSCVLFTRGKLTWVAQVHKRIMETERRIAKILLDFLVFHIQYNNFYPNSLLLRRDT
jgi:hypothetical protein